MKQAICNFAKEVRLAAFIYALSFIVKWIPDDEKELWNWLSQIPTDFTED